MLPLNLLKSQPDAVAAGLARKYVPDAEAAVARVLDADQRRRDAQRQLDETLAAAKVKAREIGQLMKAGDRAAAEALKQETSQLKARTKTLGEQMAGHAAEVEELLVALPNLPHESVPPGQRPEDNETVREVGQKPKLPADARPHWELIAHHDIVDFELGNKITGAGFPVYKGRGARLQRALINFFLDEAIAAGYVEVQPPVLVNRDSAFATGQLPDKDGQMYHVTGDDLFVIPTAEVPVTNLYRDRILTDLPVRHVAYTPCFRREAGSWGAHVRGLNRLHQFDKVEIVQVCDPAASYRALEEMLAHAEGLLQKLELPYRVLRLCGGDMSFTAALTYDLEVYSAGQQRWLEVSSVSNFEAFQANRLKLRHKPDSQGTELLHTLNGSALALPRVLAALLENNQTPDGIRLPAALHSYTGFAGIE